MKSKYRICAILFFVVLSDQMSAMEVSEEDKIKWHELCVQSTLGYFLQENTTPLSFELIGSKKFIAQKLREKLDKKDRDLKSFVKYRNKIFEELKKYDKEEHFPLLSKSIRNLYYDIDFNYLLPFILSLESLVKERIGLERAIEIKWRKEAYAYLNWETGYCRHVSYCDTKNDFFCKHVRACLELNIEKDFSLKELQSKAYSHSY